MIPAYKDTLVKVDHVSHEIAEKFILRDVDAEIKDVQTGDGVVRGQIVACVGPSGIGKTTLFNILSGLVKPTSGRVLVNVGMEQVKPGLVGVVTQDSRIFPHRTVLGNLVVAGMQTKLSRHEATEKSIEFLNWLSIADLSDHYSNQISGGERQRVAILQQLMCSDHFILLDEPFSGLDFVNKNRVCELIMKVANADELNTFIITTHDLRTAAMIADHIWMMGRDKDAAGSIIPGAYIKKVYDLIERDLCWHPNISKDPRFASFMAELEDHFVNL